MLFLNCFPLTFLVPEKGFSQEEPFCPSLRVVLCFDHLETRRAVVAYPAPCRTDTTAPENASTGSAPSWLKTKGVFMRIPPSSFLADFWAEKSIGELAS